jgi:hypothetical protein
VYTIGEGWNTKVNFEWGRYDNAYYKISSASRIWVFGGYTSNHQNNIGAAFTRDLAITISTTQVANGAYAGRWSNPALLTTPGYTKMSVGYPGTPYYTGYRIAQSRTTAAFQGAYAEWLVNPSYGIWHGMSGGPCFVWANNAWWVAGVNVSGESSTHSDAGVRALDLEADNFIRGYAY